MYTVYMHKNNINKKVYIGITKQKPEHRWNNGKGYRQNKHFYNAICKYGWDNFEHIIVATNVLPNDAYKKEMELISAYKSNDKMYGYNNSIGGECGSLGITMSESAKLKIRNANLGKHLSDETKEKVRQAHLGCLNAMYGKPSHRKGIKIGAMSDEHRYKISSSAKKRKVFCIELNKTFESVSSASRCLNVSKGGISNACSGKTESAGTFNDKKLHWKYVE